MSIEYQLEQEERYLEEQYERGEISNAEFIKQINDLYREVRTTIHEEAQQAYDDVMNGYR